MKLKSVFKTLGHVALGGALAAVAPSVSNMLPLIPHMPPLLAVAIGSALSSVVSAYSDPPHKE